MRAACGDAKLKSILAIGELATMDNVYKASLVCMMAGSDTIKVGWIFALIEHPHSHHTTQPAISQASLPHMQSSNRLITDFYRQGGCQRYIRGCTCDDSRYSRVLRANRFQGSCPRGALCLFFVILLHDFCLLSSPLIHNQWFP